MVKLSIFLWKEYSQISSKQKQQFCGQEKRLSVIQIYFNVLQRKMNVRKCLNIKQNLFDLQTTFQRNF